MVRSCTELKGTMIVPLILVETVEEQNNKTHKGGFDLCREELTAATEWAGDAAYRSRRERNLGYLSRSFLAVTAAPSFLAIWDQSSIEFLPLSLVFCVSWCMLMHYKNVFFTLAIQVGFTALSLSLCVCVARTSAQISRARECGRVTKRALYFCPHWAWSPRACMWARTCLSGLFIAEHVTHRLSLPL